MYEFNIPTAESEDPFGNKAALVLDKNLSKSVACYESSVFNAGDPARITLCRMARALLHLICSVPINLPMAFLC